MASYVLLEGTITSQSHAAFLVAIFWACITGGRYGPSWSRHEGGWDTARGLGPDGCVVCMCACVCRVVAVVQALYVSPGASLRWQLLLSLGGALLFFVAGSSSATMAAASAVAYG